MTAHLRHRPDGSVELRVNGVFVMDDLETSSERLLARVVLDLGARDVLVGGLGLGFTLRELLDGGVRSVVVAELEPQVVQWMRDGTVPGADLLADPRTTVEVRDVREVVSDAAAESFDAIVLDVDNGPDFLVHDANAAVYESGFVDLCASRLRPDGHVCVWSMNRPATLVEALAARFSEVTQTEVPVSLQNRAEAYWVLRGTGPRAARARPF